MNLGEEMQHQYLSDATQRLNIPELWTVAAMRKIRELSSVARWEVRVQFDDLCYSYQQVSVRKVQSLRSNIAAMAQTLVELLAQPSYDQQTKQECEDELQDAIQKLSEDFAEQEADFKAHSKAHFQNVVVFSRTRSGTPGKSCWRVSSLAQSWEFPALPPGRFGLIGVIGMFGILIVIITITVTTGAYLKCFFLFA